MNKILFILIDLICFVGSSCLLAYSFLNFKTYIPGKSFINPLDSSITNTSHYEVTNLTKYQIIFGVGLIALGVVIRLWRKDFKKV